MVVSGSTSLRSASKFIVGVALVLVCLGATVVDAFVGTAPFFFHVLVRVVRGELHKDPVLGDLPTKRAPLHQRASLKDLFN